MGKQTTRAEQRTFMEIKNLEPRVKRAKFDGEDSGEDNVKLPKRKVALLMGYCGTGYQGMQINKNVKTIEEDLFKALVSAGAISADNANDMNKVQFMRAARTDKGVHAMGQCVSLKMIISDENIVEKINSFLPAQIRIWDVIRTVNGFHAKNSCSSRKYEYLLPTYVLRDADPKLYARSVLAKENGVEVPADWKLPLNDTYRETPQSDIPEDEMRAIRDYRLTPEKLTHLKEILTAYTGTHNFHNLTQGKLFTEANANRYIMSFDTFEPFVSQGTEWVALNIHGQSFMLHQIRKMVALAVLMVRTKSPVAVVYQCFKESKKNVPKAPALGLLLDQTVFKAYNDRWSSKDRPRVQLDHKEAEINAFKEEWVYEKMMKTEAETNEYEQWLRGIDQHSGDFEWYLTENGVGDVKNRPVYKERSEDKGDVEECIDAEECGKVNESTTDAATANKVVEKSTDTVIVVEVAEVAAEESVSIQE